jgi:hypothetical protein
MMFRTAGRWQAKFYLAPSHGLGKHVAIGEHPNDFMVLVVAGELLFRQPQAHAQHLY